MEWRLKRLCPGNEARPLAAASGDRIGDAKERRDALSVWESEGGSRRASTLVERGKAATAELAAMTLQQARRAKLALEVRRLEARVGSNINILGHQVFPLIEAGKLEIEAPGVRQQVAIIGAAQAELRRKKAEIAALGESERAKQASMTNVDDNATDAASRAQSDSDAAADASGQPTEQGGQG